MAATNVKVALMFAPGMDLPKREDLLVTPPLPCKIEFLDRICRIEIDGGLANQQHVTIEVDIKIKDKNNLFDDSINTLARALSGLGFDNDHEAGQGHAVVGMASCDQGYGDTLDRWMPVLKKNLLDEQEK